MARGDVLTAKCPGFAPEIAELEFFVAHHTRVRRPACLVFAGEIIDNDALELIGLVHNVTRNAERMRYAARIGDRLRPAAFVLGARDTILRPHLHRDADDIVALLTQQKSGDARVHPTAHAKQNALFVTIHSNEELRSSSLPVNQVDRLLRKAMTEGPPKALKKMRQRSCMPTR